MKWILPLTLNLLLVAAATWVGQRPDLGTPATPPPQTAKAPAVSDSDARKIIKFQLDDARYSNAIQQQWLAIYQTPEYQRILNLQKQQAANVQVYSTFVAGLCKEPPGYEFSADNDVLVCKPKPQEKKP